MGFRCCWCWRILRRELRLLRWRGQHRHSSEERFGGAEQTSHQMLLQIHQPLVLCRIPAFVALAEETPLGCC